ncbi:TPA: hypothetical protein DEX28_01830 [Patescibacteria group bacterium]|nr:MAG: Formamidopyrimidine-DNA glycosylase [Parcubacteria group bacterium GW2011_GWB1_45_10]HCI05463.1 hypothetical protein [Patescibacteria group bacterium]
MPELPEVETIRRQLEKAILNKKIVKVKVLSQKQFPQNPKLVEGEKIIGVERRAKILIFRLEHRKNLIAHLKLSGQFIWTPKAEKKTKLKKLIPTIGEFLPSKSTRVILTIGKGKLFFNEMRKFGWIKLLSDEELEKELARYGIEPFKTDFSLANFEKVLQASKKAIKQVLLDQEKIAGIGNIYANESLYLSKIHPATPSNKLNKKQIESLKNSLIKVLKLGLKFGGASDEYYLHPDTTRGTYQNHFLIYGKSGEKCKNCSAVIKRISLGGRGTYFCPGCQGLANRK